MKNRQVLILVCLIPTLFFSGCAQLESRLRNIQSQIAHEKGDYKAAIVASEKGLTASRKSLGPEHPETLRHMSNLAYLYRQQGLYEKAEQLLLKTIPLRQKVLGRQHPDTLTSMNILAAVYKSQGKYQQSAKLFMQVLSARKKLFGKNSLEAANTMDNLGSVRLLQQDTRSARKLLTRALDIRKKSLGEKHEYTINTMMGVAEIFKLEGHYAASEELYRKALKFNLETRGKLHPNTWTAMNNLASVFQKQGNYTEAENLFETVYDLRKKQLGNDHPETLVSLNNLAILYLEQGKLFKAQSVFNDLLNTYQTILGKKHPRTLTVIDNLATIHRTTGQYGKAETLLKQGIGLAEEILGEEHPQTWVMMNNLALLYQALGQYDKSESLFNKVWSKRQKYYGTQHPQTVASLNNLAFLYQSQGRLKKARKFYESALNLSSIEPGIQHPDTLTIRQNLAAVFMEQGDYRLAREWMQKNLRDRQHILGEKHPDTLVSMNDLAIVFSRLDQPQKALKILQQVVNSLEYVKGVNHPDTLKALSNLATIHLELGHKQKALDIYLRTLKQRENILGPAHPATLDNRLKLAEFYLETGQIKRAFKQLRRHLKDSHLYRRQLLWKSGELTRQAYLAQQADTKNLYLSVFSHLKNREATNEFWNVSMTRKGELLSIASEISKLAQQQQSQDPVIRTLVTEFQQLRSRLSALTFSEKNAKETRLSLQEKLNEITRKLGNKVKKSLTAHDITSTSIRKHLTDNQIVLDFIIFDQVDLKKMQYGKKQLYAILTSRQEGIRLVDLGLFKPVENLVRQYRETIEPDEYEGLSSTGRQKTLDKTAKNIYQKLWKPLDRYIAGKREIFLIPDGILHLLPFKALKDENGHYLLDQYQIIRLGSVLDILSSEKAPAKGIAAIFSNPDYGTVQEESTPTVARTVDELSFDKLPGTKTEGRHIQQLLRKKQFQVESFSEQTATESKLYSLQAPSLLHLATHGYYLENVPAALTRLQPQKIQRLETGKLAITHVPNPLLRSGLAFANANKGILGKNQENANDGLVSALEVLNLDLQNTRLVVLSACETGVGEIAIGEGVYSLNRSFQEAGAKTVLSTLWSISDEGTDAFMRNFYASYTDQENTQMTLQKTQQVFKNSPYWQDPFYWAAFIMVGNHK